MAGPYVSIRPHRPGALSILLIHQAALAAVACWTWLAVLAVKGTPISGWHLLAAAGAITGTLSTVILAARYANDRAAAERHEAAMRTLVDLSWEAFTAPMRNAPMSTSDTRAHDVKPGEPGRTADVIRLSQESRHRH
jgi:hypothetical protein